MNVVFVVLAMLLHSSSGDVSGLGGGLGGIPALALLSRGLHHHENHNFPEFGRFPGGYGGYGGMHGGMYGGMHGGMYGGMPGAMPGAMPGGMPGAMYASMMHGGAHHANPMMQQLLVYQLLEKYKLQVIDEIISHGIDVDDSQKPALGKILEDFSRKMIMVAELLHQQQNGLGQHGMSGFASSPFYGFP